VAVVVTRDAGPWLEECLAGLAAQDYPALTVLVVDDGSAEDPTARIAGVTPGAFVRRLPEPVGFARAADDAAASVEGATFLLICHDDSVLDPPAVRLLVEEAYRSNAAIVGAKIVEHDRPEVLLEVGWTVDRFGHPSTGIEPGEVDQEQHDAVRDVFAVTTTTMLVRADLFAELGGFDRDASPGAEDLDLCWRARIAGARVMVAPDARARHRALDALPSAPGDATDQLNRVRVRAMLTSTSTRSLLWVAPLGFVLAVLEALGALVTGRRARARGLVRSWTANLRDLGGLRQARRRAQSMRTVPDGDLRYLQHRGSTVPRSGCGGSRRAVARSPEPLVRALGSRSASRSWCSSPW
jgi:GT2 family glycosyltransferase